MIDNILSISVILMAFISHQTGSVQLTTAQLTNTDTLSTTVTQANAILIPSLNGGDDRCARYGVTVELSADGTTITATRTETGGVATTTVTIEYTVIEFDEFTVQHFIHTHASDSDSVTISSVDTNYAFPIVTGTRNNGGFLSPDDFAGCEITSATNVNVVCGGWSTNMVTSFQIVEMSANEITSIQLIKAVQSSTTNDDTIASIDTAKSLLFCGFVSSTGGGTVDNQIPIAQLTSSTNLRTTCNTAAATNALWVHVVEFVNLSVEHDSDSPTGLTSTKVLAQAPTYGGALINGTYNRFVTAASGFDDSEEMAFTATLTGTTWTFTRTASTSTANITYSVFDWNTLLAAQETAADVKYIGMIADVGKIMSIA